MYDEPVSADSSARQIRGGVRPLRTFLPYVARHPTLVSIAGPVTREAIVVFIDVAGFTDLSERLARHGTAGTEQLGTVIRLVIGGTLDAVQREGGDAIAYGGDSVTATFVGVDALSRARRAADAVVALVSAAATEPTLEGPLDVKVRTGIGGGLVTSLVCPARGRHVLAHIGPGLDAAVAAQARATPGTVACDESAALLASGVDVAATAPLPAWAERTLHPVTASRVLAGAALPDEHRRVTSVFLALPAVKDSDPAGMASFVTLLSAAADVISDTGGDLLQCTGGDKGVVLFAVFGAPVAHADDAVRAVNAIERIRSTTGVSFAAGVATGLAFAAACGGRERRPLRPLAIRPTWPLG